ncbi:hypothetical protein NEUTE1DRAFT_98105 [Neurospora tetrasperma FGSC 2508]|uniref:Uncharacterized protein n=1 Tax=Neurospora tetrasperma (strain FGSC 2508 / ATCC MYA-4615 / P0657) TaxID=510951 RepID=F8MAM5_NEUT8|nr:uncharacterized protein NEUTE1DRAFT_98105 [Neurospora tetrasperma FGSC 2508]EGO60948.1 hypothetical protein NEUTE1DRAFT_98105 [Neurospora tetrasperma FGSC 2508]
MRTIGSSCTSLGLSLGWRGEFRSLIGFSFHCRLEHEPSQRSTVYELVSHHRYCSPYSWAAGVVDGMAIVMVVVVVGACLDHNSYIESWWIAILLRRMPFPIQAEIGIVRSIPIEVA